MSDTQKKEAELREEVACLQKQVETLRASEAALKKTQETLKTRETQQAMIAQLGLMALADTELSGVMDVVVEMLADTLKVEYTKVLELLPKKDALLLRSGVGWKKGLVGKATVGSEMASQAGYTLSSKHPVIVTDMKTEKRFSGPDLLLDHGVVSGMSVIIQGNNQPWGVLGVHTKHKHIFTQDDIYFVQVIANVLAEAIVRKEIEDELRRRERELNDFFENATMGLHWVGPDGKILRANQAELDMLGYTREEYIGHSISEFHADEPVIEDILSRLSAGETLHNYKARLRCKNGSIRHVIINSNVLWENGKFVHTRCFTRDVTEQFKAEETLVMLAKASRELGESLDYKETLTRVANLIVPSLADWCSINLVQADGTLELATVQHIDPKKVDLAWEMRRRYSLDGNSYIEMAKVVQLAKPLVFPRVTDEMLKRSAQDDTHFRFAKKLNMRSIIIAPLEIQGRVLGVLTLVSDKPGRYSNADLPLVMDLSQRCAVAVENARLFKAAQEEIVERKRVETQREEYARELARSNYELQQFAYVASHDLREPLRMISSYIQLLEDEYKDKLSDEANEYIHYAVEGSERLLDLIDDLLTYSQVNASTKAFMSVDVENVINKVCLDLKLSIQRSDAQITYADLPTVKADKTQLAQVFQNLLSNAIKFQSQTAPKIHISAQKNQGYWQFCVADNGIGIDPKFSDRIFNIFHRLHAHEAFPGTGIGLAVCKKIIERHGGDIWVESEAGMGAKFFFTLPNPKPALLESGK